MFCTTRMASSTTLNTVSLIKLESISSQTCKLNSQTVQLRVKGINSVANLSAVSHSTSNGAVSSSRDTQLRMKNFCYDKAIPEERIEKPVGTSLAAKDIGDNLQCDDCHTKGAVLCTTCSGAGLYVDAILQSQGIIVKVRCLGCGGTGNQLCCECGGGGHLWHKKLVKAVSSSADLRLRMTNLCYDKAIPEEIIEKPVGMSLSEKDIGDNLPCVDCHTKGAVLCTTCSGVGLYVDAILQSQGIIVKVRCLGCGGNGNVVCSGCGGRGHH